MNGGDPGAHDYWLHLGRDWLASDTVRLWRAHVDSVVGEAVARWLPAGKVGLALKTDVFEEASGRGLAWRLIGSAGRVMAIDLSSPLLGAARARTSGLTFVQADVRTLPLAPASVDLVLSTSTLDHFASVAELRGSLRELARVLRTGGELLITLDNVANPLIALRNAMPHPLRIRLGLTPYYVGRSFTPWRLRKELRAVGLEPRELITLLHCPRAIAIPVARLLDRRMPGDRGARRFCAWLGLFEWLGKLPSRYLTGLFVAARAVRSETQSRPGSPAAVGRVVNRPTSI